MIYPKKNIFLKWMVQSYLRWITARNFHQINFNAIPVDQNQSVLLIANHFSAWDGIVLFHINRLLFKKNFYVMLLDSTAKKEPLLKYVGGFSINKNSREIVKSLDFAATLLSNPQNLVLIFPQGKLYSNMVSDVIFEKGVINVIKKAGAKFQLIFAATFIENFEHFKPVANTHLKISVKEDFSNITDLQAAYQRHYTQARQQQTAIIKQ